MNNELDIKEMESVIRDILSPYNDKDPEVEAWLLVEQEGWRKQKEGRWISASTKPGTNIGMKCSLCGARIKYSEFYNGNHNYCHKCGAKMIKEIAK